MKRTRPQGLNRRRVNQLLSKTKHEPRIGRRIEVLSRVLLGAPYKSNPLIGSADTDEVFTAGLNGFDCVTYIETIMALALSEIADDFTEWLRKIRYEHGEIQWIRRNHYMTSWVRNNAREGIVRPVLVPTISRINRVCMLSIVPGITTRRVSIRCIPKAAVPSLESRLQTGDLMLFVSTRRELDVFHAGIIVVDHNKVLMRHASRSQGLVVEQELKEFLRTNRLAGIIVVRPQDVRKGITAVTRRRRISNRGSSLRRNDGTEHRSAM